MPAVADSSTLAFQLLHPKLQEKIYSLGWTKLRSIQVEAIQAVLGGCNEVIISAATASGKTEAAFLPIISSLIDDRTHGVRALYVGPLRALINDQFSRLEDLSQKADIPVHRWHGDVSRTAKTKLLDAPSGILLITPESIESLFINQSAKLPNLFPRLKYIVIDEVHSFFGTERGAHLRSLLNRMQAFAPNKPTIVGLSATLGDPKLAASWLFGNDTTAKIIVAPKGEKEIKYSLHGYVRPTVDKADSKQEKIKHSPELAKDIIRWFNGKTALIFGNSKAILEETADDVKRLIEEQNLRDHFRVHHGSLSKVEREDSEAELRSEIPTGVFCSSTLEMGINVGNVSVIGQLGAPFSVNSLVQRLGRSGRRENEPTQMRMMIEENRANDSDDLIDKLHVGLLQAVAMSELAFDQWCEPPITGRAHLSTLVQQILSIIAQRGSATATLLKKTLVGQHSFREVDDRCFAEILASMLSPEHDLIEQTSSGEYILGLKGEKTVRSLDFYAVFSAEVTWTVHSKDRKIGTVSIPPPVGECLILAGRRWEVIELDSSRLDVLVSPAKGKKGPMIIGGADTDIHPCVRERMFEIAVGSEIFPYLDRTAQQLLVEAQECAEQLDLAHRKILQTGKAVYWFTWTGDRTQRALELLSESAGFNSEKVVNEDIVLRIENTTIPEFKNKLKNVLLSPPSSTDLAARLPLTEIEKYDKYIPIDLRVQRVGMERLDLSTALLLAQEMTQAQTLAAT